MFISLLEMVTEKMNPLFYIVKKKPEKAKKDFISLEHVNEIKSAFRWLFAGKKHDLVSTGRPKINPTLQTACSRNSPFVTHNFRHVDFRRQEKRPTR